jgi:hypothetical protein
VTVTTIQAIVADMMFMTKLDGLLAFNPLAGVPGRAIQFRAYPKRRQQNKNCTIDRQLREGVRAVMKNLGHRGGLANPSLQNSAIQ